MVTDPRSDALASNLEGCDLIRLRGHEARILTQPPKPFLSGLHIVLCTAI
jgi:hypothetical protein